MDLFMCHNPEQPKELLYQKITEDRLRMKMTQTCFCSRILVQIQDIPSTGSNGKNTVKNITV